jgi:hypothetical protein
VGYQQDAEGRALPGRLGEARTCRGPIRNKPMLEEGKPDLVVAFPSGRGTANMMKQAREAGVPVRVITADIVRQLECIPDQ